MNDPKCMFGDNPNMSEEEDESDLEVEQQGVCQLIYETYGCVVES